MKDKKKSNVIIEDNNLQEIDELLSDSDEDDQSIVLANINESTPGNENAAIRKNDRILSRNNIDETILLEPDDNISNDEDEILELTDIADENEGTVLLSDIQSQELIEDDDDIIELDNERSTPEDGFLTDEYHDEPTADLTETTISDFHQSEEIQNVKEPIAPFIDDQLQDISFPDEFSHSDQTTIPADSEQSSMLPIEQQEHPLDELLTDIETKLDISESELVLPDNIDDLLVPADEDVISEISESETSEPIKLDQSILQQDESTASDNLEEIQVSDDLQEIQMDELLVPAEEQDSIEPEPLGEESEVAEGDILVSSIEPEEIKKDDFNIDNFDNIPVSIEDIIDLADVKPIKKADEVIDLAHMDHIPSGRADQPTDFDMAQELTSEADRVNPFIEKTIVIKELDERLVDKPQERYDTEKTILVNDLDNKPSDQLNEKTIVVSDLDDQKEPEEEIIDLIDIKVLPDDANIESITKPIERIDDVHEPSDTEIIQSQQTEISLLEENERDKKLETISRPAEDVLASTLGLIDVLSSSDATETEEHTQKEDILKEDISDKVTDLKKDDTILEPIESEQPIQSKSMATDKPIDTISKEYSLPPEQVEAVIERVVRKMFAEKIDKLLMGIIEKAVTKEMNRLKNLLIEDLTRDI